MNFIPWHFFFDGCNESLLSLLRKEIFYDNQTFFTLAHAYSAGRPKGKHLIINAVEINIF